MGWLVWSGAAGSAGCSSPGTGTFFLDARGSLEAQARFHEPEDVPDESAELPRDSHGDFVALLATGAQLHHALVQPGLCFPGAGLDVFRQALLAEAQFLADLGAETVLTRLENR